MMTKLKRILALLTALTLCLSLAACNNHAETESDNADPENSASAEVSDSPDETSTDPDSSPAPEASDPIADIDVDLNQTMYEFSSGLKDSDTAVTVNGVDISNDEFFYWLSYYCYNAAYYGSFYGYDMDFSDAEIRQDMIDSTTDAVAYHAVLRQMCEKENVVPNETQLAEVQQQIDENGLDYLLKSYGVTEPTLRRIAEDNYLFTNYSDKKVGQPSEADLEQYVSDNGIFSVKHILLRTVDENNNPLGDSEIAEKRTKAEDLLAQLKAANDLETTFDTLMNENSEDTGLAYYPDGYTYDKDDSLVDGFREGVLALEPGQMSDIVETSYGYHILLRLPVDANSYHDEWLSEKGEALVRAEVDKADIKVSDGINNLDLKNFYNRYMAYSDALYSSMSSED